MSARNGASRALPDEVVTRQAAEGEYTIRCPEGTTVTLRDGGNGADGGCASAPVATPRNMGFGALLIGMALLIRRRS